MGLLAGCENACSPGRSPRPVVSDSVGLDRGQMTCISDRFQVVLRKGTQRQQRAAAELGEDCLRESAIPAAVNPHGVWRGAAPSEPGRAQERTSGAALPGTQRPRLSSQPFFRRTPLEGKPLEASLPPVS